MERLDFPINLVNVLHRVFEIRNKSVAIFFYWRSLLWCFGFSLRNQTSSKPQREDNSNYGVYDTQKTHEGRIRQGNIKSFSSIVHQKLHVLHVPKISQKDKRMSKYIKGGDPSPVSRLDGLV